MLADPQESLLLRITRLGGHLLLLKPQREAPFTLLSKAEQIAVEEVLSGKFPEIKAQSYPDSTSYKFELEGPTTRVSITISASKIPNILSKLLP